eukprot:9037218-Pyramimonas_sp.AAC.1
MVPIVARILMIVLAQAIVLVIERPHPPQWDSGTAKASRITTAGPRDHALHVSGRQDDDGGDVG